jgi:hypothetical protein
LFSKNSVDPTVRELSAEQIEQLADRFPEALADLRAASNDRALARLLALNRPELTAHAARELKGTDLLFKAVTQAVESGPVDFVTHLSDPDLAVSWIERHPDLFARKLSESRDAMTRWWKTVPENLRGRVLASRPSVLRALGEDELVRQWLAERAANGDWGAMTEVPDLARPLIRNNLAAVCRSPEAQRALTCCRADKDLAGAILAVSDLPKLRAVELAFGADVAWTINWIRSRTADQLLSDFDLQQIDDLPCRGPLDWETILKNRVQAAAAVDALRRGCETNRKLAPGEGTFLISEMKNQEPVSAAVFIARNVHPQEAGSWISELIPTMSEEQIVSVLSRSSLASEPWLVNLVLQKAAAKAKPWLREHWQPMVFWALQNPDEVNLASALSWAAQVESADRVSATALKACPIARVMETLQWVRDWDPNGFEAHVRARGTRWLSQLSHSELETLDNLCKGFPDLSANVRAQLNQAEANAARKAVQNLEPIRPASSPGSS